jgi:4-hydroxy-4-methyl-2-oxoglutarate aldolase
MNPLSSNDRPAGSLDELRRFDTCLLANAVERLNIRPRNEGFMCGGPPCRFPQIPPVEGYAVPGRIRTYMPPVAGKRYYDHIEWWRHVETIPAPRIVVLEDCGDRPGFGASLGEVHARICRALGCVVCMTNGAVRDLEAIEGLGFQVFARSVSVSHAYAHIVDFGNPVEIGGLQVQPGDILHADRHGILSLPLEMIERLPSIAEQIQCEEKDLFALTESPEFSVEALGTRLQQFTEKQPCP